jgi:hypothetical protein
VRSKKTKRVSSEQGYMKQSYANETIPNSLPIVPLSPLTVQRSVHLSPARSLQRSQIFQDL